MREHASLSLDSTGNQSCSVTSAKRGNSFTGEPQLQQQKPKLSEAETDSMIQWSVCVITSSNSVSLHSLTGPVCLCKYMKVNVEHTVVPR